MNNLNSVAAVGASGEVNTEDSTNTPLLLDNSTSTNRNIRGIGTAAEGQDGQSTIAIEDIRTNVYVKHRNAIILPLVKALMDRSEKTRCQRKKFHVKTSLTKLPQKTLETSRKMNEVLISENTNLEHEYDNAVKRNENANRYAENFKKQMLGQTEEMQAWNTVNKVLDNRKEGLVERNLALQKQNEGLIEQNQFLDGEHAEVWNDNELAHQQLSAGREKYAELLEKHTSTYSMSTRAYARSIRM
ncbi:hypothetical protein NpPPO83_00011012 [Neofusicoccum parvum]|uniref:Uncharacterized protein n=1 Tax=Neofusicoccum parvum TaxID=310453 RepID=A0ACB5SFT0_9PEZI|nr:hypothetical protein NpPPO83_00011012 [Neofusicoccum parvum]